MTQQNMSFDKEIITRYHLDYLLYLPKAYGQSDTKWPLILFLHGAGERGNDLEIVKRNGIPKIVEDADDFPFIAVSPQCPMDRVWENSLDDLSQLLDHIAQNYEVDEDRIYVTGLSMGGYGTWDLAMMYPYRFAAIIPICGGATYPELVVLLKNLPIWAFHGAKDDIVPPTETRKLAAYLNQVGGNIRYTEYPEATHDSWTATYNNAEIYKWLLSHSRKPI